MDLNEANLMKSTASALAVATGLVAEYAGRTEFLVKRVEELEEWVKDDAAKREADLKERNDARAKEGHITHLQNRVNTLEEECAAKQAEIIRLEQCLDALLPLVEMLQPLYDTSKALHDCMYSTLGEFHGDLAAPHEAWAKVLAKLTAMQCTTEVPTEARIGEDKDVATRKAARLGAALARLERLHAAVFRFQRAVDAMLPGQSWNPSYGHVGDAVLQHVSDAYKDLFTTDYEVRAYVKAKRLAGTPTDEMDARLKAVLGELELLSNSVTVFQRAIGEMHDTCAWNPKSSYATNRPSPRSSLGYVSEVYQDMIAASFHAADFLKQGEVGSANLDESAG